MSQQEVFLALVRAGLWNEEVRLESVDNINFAGVRRMAEDQSVVGLVTAGVEKLPAGKLPLTEKLKFAGLCQLIEQRNVEMNVFVADWVQSMQEEGIDAVIVKGQGVAQCYEKPLWRVCGDVDFLLDEENYEKAKAFLNPFASSVDKESAYNKHLGMTIGGYSVELHGNLRCGLSKRMDDVIDGIQQQVCSQGKVRTWQNDNVPISLPAPSEDAIFIFTHFLKHFYKGGLGLRQICDWCRLLWTYRNEIDVTKLDKSLRKMGLVTEWKAFGAFAVERLGMPIEAMPLYEGTNRWCLKASRIDDFVMMSGNFGHNRDSSYWTKNPYLIRKACSMNRRVGDLISHARIFPLDSIRFFFAIMRNGIRSVINGD